MMGGFLLHEKAKLKCPHGGEIQGTAASDKVKVDGKTVVTKDDTFSISGCAFTVGPKPQPCVKAKWLKVSSKVKVGGKPVVLKDSSGLCESGEKIPQGPPNVTSTQEKVEGK